MDTGTRLLILDMGKQVEHLANDTEDRSSEIKEIAQRLQKVIVEYPATNTRE